MLVGPSGVGKTETALALADLSTAVSKSHHDQHVGVSGGPHGFDLKGSPPDTSATAKAVFLPKPCGESPTR